MATTAQPKRSPYPDALRIPPQSGVHKQSFIILHGRGSNADRFAKPLLMMQTTTYGKLQDAFPDATLIFPTASKRRAKIYKRSLIDQWFDNWSLDQPDAHIKLQFEGLRESSEYVHELLRAEIAAVGASNVVLWGLSQGCAASLISLLFWEGEHLAACIGMCGWLSLRKPMEEAVRNQGRPADGEWDPFGGEDEAATQCSEIVSRESTFDRLAICLREMLDLPCTAIGRDTLDTLIFIGHGVEDDRVPLHLAQEAASLLKEVGSDVSYTEYPDLGHWYSEAMLGDIVCFLQHRID